MARRVYNWCYLTHVGDPDGYYSFGGCCHIATDNGIDLVAGQEPYRWTQGNNATVRSS